MKKTVNDKLLMVDDDKNIVKLLTVLFSKTYDMKTALNGESALEIIKSGFNPGVIISDQLMPGMDGVEFLQIVKKLLPKSVTIILTGISSPKEVIKIVNDSDAYMFMKKPFNNLELLQSIKVAFNHYNNTAQKIELTKQNEKNKKELSIITEQLSAKNIETGSGVSQIIKVLSNLSKINEHFYFKDHINDVSQISQHLAMRCRLDEKSVKRVVYGALLHLCWMIGLPDRYKLINIHGKLDKIEREEIVNHFKRYIYAMKQNESIKEYVNEAIKLFEHADGSGLPVGLVGLDFPPEAQIISLANLYHDFVYKLPLERVHEIKKEGIITQTKEVTFARHQECISFMHKNLKWYDHDIFATFQEMLKKRDILALAFSNSDLTIKINPKAHAVITEADDKLLKQFEELEAKERKNIILIDENGVEVDSYTQIKVPIEDIQKGMKLTQDIHLNDETILIKKFTVLTAKLIFKIEELAQAGALGEHLFIVEPEEMV